MAFEVTPAALAAQDAIKTVIYSYCRAIDRCDAALLASVFHADATLDHGQIITAAAFQRGVFDQLKESWTGTQHFIGNVLVSVDGESARSEAYFIAHHISRVPPGDLPTLVALGGRYLDRFERRGGDWRIAHRILVKDWQDTRPYADVRIRAYKAQRPDGLDPSYSAKNAPR